MAEPCHALHGVSTRDWSFDGIVASSTNFLPVKRVSCGADLSAVLEDYRNSDVPLVIEGWHLGASWDPDLLSLDWFAKHAELPDGRIDVRNVHTWLDDSIPLQAFIDKSRSTKPAVVDGETERLYGKDAICPPAWSRWLHESSTIPRELLPDDDSNLLNALPESTRVEHLMCYLGVGDTFTPMHKDLCASYGHNLMTYTENGGSSYWFMTRGSDAQRAAEYFHKLGQELDHENHVISLAELRDAPFKVYIVEQKLGDMVFVPPRSAHQVVNSGGITVKTSWSRMELSSLETALFNELPVYRRVCRRETYKVKSLIHYLLLQTTASLECQLGPLSSLTPSIAPILPSDAHRLRQRLSLLLPLYDHILVDEYTDTHADVPHLSSDTNQDIVSPSSSASTLDSPHDFPTLVCDFCGADIFQSFFQCTTCGPSPEVRDVPERVYLCAGCYVEGRTCRCEVMEPVQFRPFSALLSLRKRARYILTETLPHDSSSAGTFLENEHSLVRHKGGATFNTALILRDIRCKPPKKATRSCRNQGRESHQVAFYQGLRCGPCHDYRCFRHILELYSTHVTSALAFYHSRPDQWHQHHAKRREAAEEGRAAFCDAQETGQRPTCLDAMRAAVATIFSDCRPLRPSSVTLGFYDSVDETGSITADSSGDPITSDEVDNAAKSPPPPQRKCKRRPATPSSDGTLSDTSTASEYAPPPKATRRRLPNKPRKLTFDCVLVTPWSVLARKEKRSPDPGPCQPPPIPSHMSTSSAHGPEIPPADTSSPSPPLFAPLRFQTQQSHRPKLPFRRLATQATPTASVPADVFMASQRLKRTAPAPPPAPPA